MLWLTVEATPGDDVEEIIGEMIQLARTLNVGVESNFNGHHIFITAHSSFDQTYYQYLRDSKERHEPQSPQI